MVVMSDEEFEEMMQTFNRHIACVWEEDDGEIEEEYELTCDCECECEDDGDNAFCITPKGIAALTLLNTGLVDDIADPRIDGFWVLFESRMGKLGYVERLDDDE